MRGCASAAFIAASLLAVAADDPPVKTFPITVKGTALDTAGKPIAGATVYIASTQPGWKRLAETTTDDQGRYEFRGVPLPIDLASTNIGRDRGAFEVFGRADGYGFAWRPRKWFYPGGKPTNFFDNPDEDQPVRFDANDRIALDLIFPRPARFRGRVVNEQGEPISGTTVSIQYCDPVWNQADYDVYRSRKKFESLNARDSVPAEMKRRVTDADGRFEFNELPPNCRFHITVRPDGFLKRSLWAVTRDGIQADRHGNNIYSDGAKLVFVTPREIPIRVLYADTAKPAANVFVMALRSDGTQSGTTNADGNVTLRLPPGTTDYKLFPEHGTSYFVTTGELEIADESPERPIELKLRRAAVVEVTVVNALTAQPLPGVDLWIERKSPNGQSYRREYHFSSWKVGKGVGIDQTRTDIDGKIVTLFEPGWHMLGVGLDSYPKGYVPTEPDGRAVECLEGKTTRVTFKMRPKE